GYALTVQYLFVVHPLGYAVWICEDNAAEYGTSMCPFFKRGNASLFVDYMYFTYDDFRDARDTESAPGEEELYDFDAFVLRAFVSFFF
ncbi:MAG: hypothetical protein AAGH19_07575, partial [Pseudomonadota bacterium]